jgi:general secretion pathway protein D
MPISSPPFPARILVCALTLALASCATTPPTSTISPPQPPRAAKPSSDASAGIGAAASAADAESRSKIYKGTGVLIKTPPQIATATPPGGIMLNFEGADLREVVRNILGDILNESYTIDATVGGQVTIRTTSGIPRDSLPATLEMLLRMNGATMVKEEGIWKILPQAAAVRGNITPQLGNVQRPLAPGYSVQIVPLRYVGVREMIRVLEPFVRDAQTVRADDLRNFLILNGTERELRHLLETIDMFDVDWMAGMSVGLFTLQSADVKTVMQDITKALGEPNVSPLTGVLRIIPIERLNAILVITPQPAYLDEAKKWVERLDKSGTDAGGVRFYVYNLQYQHADKIGPLLQQAFSGRATQQITPSGPTVAPGTPAGTIVSPPPFGTTPPPTGAATPPPAPGTPPQGAVQRVAAGVAGAAGEGVGIVRNLQVVADKDNNTLLIVATPAEYSLIEQALKKLDVPQRQVLMEVTMAEVKLTDNLSMGVEALFRNLAPSGRGAAGSFNASPAFNPGGTGTSGLGIPSGANFAYIINSAKFPGGIQAVLNLMDSYGNTKVLANPQLAALDNQKATIKVGDRIPVCTSNVVPGTVASTTFQTTSQYIDTGTLFQVTPHINANGIVTLDVQAEVSIPGPLSASCDQPPTINTRSVQTLLSVPSGQTMVMGGLIADTRIAGTEGIPFISRIPVLGGLFGSQSLAVTRVELVIFITPRVIEGDSGVSDIVEDLRKRMERLDFAFPVTPLTREPSAGETARRKLNELYPALTPMQRGGFSTNPVAPESAPPAPAPAPGEVPAAAPAAKP